MYSRAGISRVLSCFAVSKASRTIVFHGFSTLGATETGTVADETAVVLGGGVAKPLVAAYGVLGKSGVFAAAATATLALPVLQLWTMFSARFVSWPAPVAIGGGPCSEVVIYYPR